MNSKGFIALMSAIIISFAILAVTVSVGMPGIFVRLNILDAELKLKSEYLAQGCIDMVLFEYASLGILSNNKKFSFEDGECYVVGVDLSSNKISATAAVGRATTNLEVVFSDIENFDFSVVSRRECYYFENGLCVN